MPNVLKPFFGYLNNLEVSIIISCGIFEYESQILYISKDKNINFYLLNINFLTLILLFNILVEEQRSVWLVQ